MNYSVRLTVLASVASALMSHMATAADLTGDLIQGGLAVVKVAPFQAVEYKKHSLVADDNGQLLIGFARDDKANQTLYVFDDKSQKKVVNFKIDTRSYDVQRINGLPRNKVTPDKKTQEKIWQDILKAKAARKLDLPDNYYLSGFGWPVDSGIISGIYGSQRILNGKPRRPHFGIDVAAPTGTPMLAPADGEVTLAEDMELSGKTLMIDHGRGLRSTLMHMDSISVKKGQKIKRGQTVGTVGTTGRSTGPHVHWGMSWFNERLDPALVVSERTITKGMKLQDQVLQ